MTHKRQRTSKNMYLDIEAIADDGDESEEVDQDVEDDFLDDIEESGDETHSDLYRSMRQVDEEDGLGQRISDEEWEEFEQRSRRRSSRWSRFRSEKFMPVEDVGYQLEDTDMLWEIGCQVGKEETIAFKVLMRACHPLTPETLASSIVATAIPGRIYAEVSGLAQATKLARSFAELDSSRILPVPREDIPGILNFASSRHACQQWARVEGKKKWSWYQGDTGFIDMIEGSGKKYLALIPRLDFDNASDAPGRQSRPYQALIERAVLEDQVGASLVEDDEYGRFIWKKQRFSADGFLLVDVDDIDVLPLLETLPSSAELAVFRSTPLLPAGMAAQTDRRIGETRRKVGDRVKVVVGTYLGMMGNIVAMNDNVVSVYLPSQDTIEDMMQDTVRAAFDIGDQVHVLDGEMKGLIGWVIGIFVDGLRILNIKDNIEVNVRKIDVEFHSATVVTGLRPRDEYPKWGKLGGQNPNDVHIGKRVMVIGMHELKGYKGRITSTTTTGHAFVQLDSRLQRSSQIKLLDLACLTHEDTPGTHLLSNRSFPATAIPASSESSSSTSIFPPNTPVWDASSNPSLYLSPAWDPSSRTPPPPDRPSRPIHWLDDPDLGKLRLKLETSDRTVESPYVEFLGIENDMVKVRDKADYKFVSFDSVNALLPGAKGDLVTFKEGDMQGLYFKIIEIAEGRCVIRTPGTKRPSKKNPDLGCQATDLIQVYPGSR